MATHQPLENLYLIDLDQSLEGFRNFISSWVYRRGDVTILVDPGPRSTIPVLVDALKQAGVDQLDYIFLTHIHIDHAGGAGLLLEHYPDARVICHPKGIRHMVDPAKLWEGSRKVLGRVAEVYGEIAPIPEENISYKELVRIGDATVQVYETPGHAPHHLCYHIGDILFAGEVAGVYYPLEQGMYIRLATPPPFIYEVFRGSIDKMAALKNVTHLCFGHYGYCGDVKNVFDTARDQLDNWLATGEKHYKAGTEHFEERVFEEVLKTDRGLKYFYALPEDIQAREKNFCFNSFRGIRAYLEKING